MRRADSARSASGSASPASASGTAREARGGRVKVLIILSIPPIRRSNGSNLRVCIDTLYYRSVGLRLLRLASTRAVLYTFAPFVKTYFVEHSMYTVFSKPEETRGDWFLVDAAGKNLGRLASAIARRLKGKHMPQYAPQQDLGAHIVVLHKSPRPFLWT